MRRCQGAAEEAGAPLLLSVHPPRAISSAVGAEEHTPSLCSCPSCSWQEAQSNPVVPWASLGERSPLTAEGLCPQASYGQAERSHAFVPAAATGAGRTQAALPASTCATPAPARSNASKSSLQQYGRLQPQGRAGTRMGQDSEHSQGRDLGLSFLSKLSSWETLGFAPTSPYLTSSTLWQESG